MKLSHLVKKLSEKPQQSTDVEFIVVDKKTGGIIAMEIENQAPDVVKALRLFKGVKA